MDLEEEDSNRLLKEFRPLIHRALKDLNISPTHMDYEDFAQEFSIHLLEIEPKFSGDIFNCEEDRYNFTAFARRGLHWHGVNLIRKNQTPSFPTDDSWLFEEESIGKSCPVDIDYSEMICTSFMKEAKDKLTVEEYDLLEYVVEDKYTNNEIAERMQMHRSTFYARKTDVQIKLAGLKEILY